MTHAGIAVLTCFLAGQLVSADTKQPLSSVRQSSSELPIAISAAAIAVDQTKRAVLLNFEIGSGLADGTQVEYTASVLDPADRVVSQVTRRSLAKRGRALGEVKLNTSLQAPIVRFTAHVPNTGMQGVLLTTVRVPDETLGQPTCGGFVFEPAAVRLGIREFTRSSSVTISTLVWAQDLNGTVAPLSFALSVPGGSGQRTWPVQLGIPLGNGVWRVAFTLKAPLPAGNQEIRLLRRQMILAENCVAQFATR